MLFIAYVFTFTPSAHVLVLFYFFLGIPPRPLYIPSKYI